MHIVSAEDDGVPLTHAELGRRVGLSSGATSSLINRLEAAGHVERVRSKTDRRVVTVRSTAAGHEEVRAFFAEVDTDLRATVARYSPDLVEQLAAMLTDITAAAIRHLAPTDAPPRPG